MKLEEEEEEEEEDEDEDEEEAFLYMSQGTPLHRGCLLAVL